MNLEYTKNEAIEHIKSAVRRIISSEECDVVDCEDKIKTIRIISENLSEEEIYDDISDIIANEVTVTSNRNTIGDYLMSCNIEQKEVLVECTPGCIKGLSNKYLDSCSVPVFIYKDTLIHLNAISGDRVYLFEENNEVSSQLDSIINVLRTDYKVLYVDLYKRDKELSYKYIETYNTTDILNNDRIKLHTSRTEKTILLLAFIVLGIMLSCLYKGSFTY